MNLRILFFINSEVGGAEKMSVFISKMLIRHGIKPGYVIVKDKLTAASITDFLPKGQWVEIIEAKNNIEKVLYFWRLIQKKKPDVVFSSHLSINDKLLLLKPFFTKVRFVIRSDNYYSTYRILSKLFIKITYRFADIMITQNEEMKDEFILHNIMSPAHIITLENPVDKEMIDTKLRNAKNPYPKDGKMHIVAVGRFSHQKGYDYLAKSFAIVRPEYKNCELYIIGGHTGRWQPEFDRFISLVKELGIEKDVHCMGYQSNPYKYIKYADCFVLSSRWEGLPNVLAESLYLRTPVAAFKCIPIIERMVRDGIDGHLAEKEDVTGLSSAIMKAIELGRTNPVYAGSNEQDFVELFVKHKITE